MDTDKLILRHIDEDPDWCEPEHARLRASGVPVWAVIGYYRVSGGRAERVAADYHIPEEAVRAAVEYYHRHQGPIDAVLTLNGAPM